MNNTKVTLKKPVYLGLSIPGNGEIVIQTQSMETMKYCARQTQTAS